MEDLTKRIIAAFNEQPILLKDIARGDSGYRLIFERRLAREQLEQAAEAVSHATRTTYQLSERILGRPWHYVLSFRKA